MTTTRGGVDISLVIPCYQEEPHFLESVATLRKTLELTRWTWEMIFVDDKSTDGTRELISRVCAQAPDLFRSVFHDKNRGRGAAFKSGFKLARGRIAGFIDIDLEIGAHYVVSLCQLIDEGTVDVATGYRYYLLSQTGGWLRHILSIGYRAGCNVLIGSGIGDSETGIKFFNREKCASVILGSENDGWFWDTEVMTRAALGDLRIREFPVLFLRRHDKQSTVRPMRDIPRYLVALLHFRPRVGLGLWDRSPIYWTGVGYNLVMRLFHGRKRSKILAQVAELIEPGSSVVNLCCGTAILYSECLADKGVQYLGLDSNGHFVLSLRRRGVHARLSNLQEGEALPQADVVVMCSSFYHYRAQENELLVRMNAAAKKRVIISEPMWNSSHSRLWPIRILSRWLGRNPDGGYPFRHSLETFRSFAQSHGATRVIYEKGAFNAIAVFDK